MNRSPENPGHSENPVDAMRGHTVMRIFYTLDKGIGDLAERLGDGLVEGSRSFVHELFKKKP